MTSGSEFLNYRTKGRLRLSGGESSQQVGVRASYARHFRVVVAKQRNQDEKDKLSNMRLERCSQLLMKMRLNLN